VDIDVVALLSRNEEWNLEDAEFSKKRYKACYYLEDDTLTGKELANRTYMQESHNQVEIIGSENYMERMSYDNDHRDGSTDHFSAKALVK
jgi:hypothetical protein